MLGRAELSVSSELVGEPWKRDSSGLGLPCVKCLLGTFNGTAGHRLNLGTGVVPGKELFTYFGHLMGVEKAGELQAEHCVHVQRLSGARRRVERGLA